MNKLIQLFVAAYFFWPSMHGFRFPTLAPFDDDQEIMSQPQLAKHFETEFSICSRDHKCPESGATVLIHRLVHFWPGDRFEIPCTFCTRNFLSSGNTKIWRYMNLANAFGWNKDAAGRRESWEFLKGSSEKWLNVKDYEKGQMSVLYSNGNWPHVLNEDRPKPRYFQKDGKLIILHGGLENQGVYNCYDRNNPNALDVVYVAVLTAPLALIDCYILNAFENKDTDFVTKHMNVTVVDRFAKCQLIYHTSGTEKTLVDILGHPDVQPNLVWRHQHVPAPAADFVVNLKHPLLKVDSFNLMVYFKWSEWSSCNACLPYRGWRIRDGHCYVKKNKPAEPIKYEHFHYGNMDAASGSRVAPDRPLSGAIEGRMDIYFDFLTTRENQTVLKTLEYLDDLLSPGSPVFGEEGFRLDSSLVVPLFCSEHPDMVAYYQCLIHFFNYVFNSMPVYDGATMKPKMDQPIREKKFPVNNDYRQIVPCFAFSYYHIKQFLPYNPGRDPYMKPQYKTQEFVQKRTREIIPKYVTNAQIGYYIDSEPCVQECPGYSDTFFPP